MKRYWPLGALLAVVLVLPLLLSLVGTYFFLNQLTMAAYYSLVVIGLCLLMGYAGQISLGHAGFFALGGYTAAVISTLNFSSQVRTLLVQQFLKLGLMYTQPKPFCPGEVLVLLDPCFGLITAIIAVVSIALLVGLPILRLKGHYLAMATLAFGFIVQKLILGIDIFGGADGIHSVPALKLFPGLSIQGSQNFRLQNFYFAWVLVALALVLALNLINSRIGRALRSIHDSEEAANALGIHTKKYKLYTFVLSAVMAGLAGVFMTHYIGGIGPSEASIMKSVRYVAIVSVGGMSHLGGVVAMSVALNFITLRGYFGYYDNAVFGLILIAVMLFAPHGVLRIKWLRMFIQDIKSKLSRYVRKK